MTYMEDFRKLMRAISQHPKLKKLKLSELTEENYPYQQGYDLEAEIVNVILENCINLEYFYMHEQLEKNTHYYSLSSLRAAYTYSKCSEQLANIKGL